MQAYSALPTGYAPLLQVDLQKNKRQALLVNALAVGIGVAMVVPMHFLVPLQTLFDLQAGPWALLGRVAALWGAMVAYLLLHEGVHGLAMRLCGTEKVRYGFTGLYAFAGSDDYYDKGAYLFIALAPVVLWGAVLAAVQPLVGGSWFWVCYLVQVMNLSGAAGDLYVTCRFLCLPGDILVKDCGVGMTVYHHSK